jgi:hypothetical protein
VLPRAKDGELGVTVTDVSWTAVPVPERLTVWGLLLALSVIVTSPVLVPAAVGVNVMLIVHFPKAATVNPQVFDCAKSPATTMLVMERLVGWLLVRVTDVAGLVVPIN